MNILPSSLSSTSSSAATAFITTIATNNNDTCTSSIDNRSSIMINSKCSVCDEQLQLSQQQNHEQQQQQQELSSIPYRMLAVRPSIGSKDPFFPILETLTQTSAITVPCCLRCSDLLLEQWNEFELKNIPIKNRLYNVPKMKIIKSNLMIMADNNNHHQQQQQQKHSNKSSIVSIAGVTTPTATRILAHPISLSTNDNNNNGNLINVQQQKSAAKDTSTRTPCLQDEVLDLSMTGVNSNSSSSTTMKIDSNNINPSMLTMAVDTTTMSGTLNKSTVLTGHRPRTSSSSSSGGGIGDNIIAISPYSLNSSMTNLIKVSANPVVSTLNLSSNNNHSSTLMMAKKPLYSCTLCHEQCTELYSILLRPMGNCPYFPSLTQDIKIPTIIDSNGKIGNFLLSIKFN